jgi:hypothetical protein
MILLNVVFSLRQQGAFRFIVADFLPCGQKIRNNENDSHSSIEDSTPVCICIGKMRQRPAIMQKLLVKGISRFFVAGFSPCGRKASDRKTKHTAQVLMMRGAIDDAGAERASRCPEAGGPGHRI